MITEKSEIVRVLSGDDVVHVRRVVRALAVGIGFSLVDQTKVVTAASEIARNTVDYGGGGSMLAEAVREGARKGVRMVFSDNGPGIENLDLAMTDGFTTGKGLGLGLTGAKRLSSEFDIASAPGKGTVVTLIRWK